MSQYKVQFESANIVKKLDDAKRKWIDEIPLENLQGQAKEDYERLLKVLLYLESQFKIVDAELYPLNSWNNFVNRINNIASYGQNFRQSKNQSHLQNANNEVDALSTEFRLRNEIQSPELANAISTSITKLITTVGIQLDELAGKRTSFEKQIAELTQTLATLKTQSTTAGQTIQNQSQRLDTAIAEHQKQFSAAQEKRSLDFSTSQKSREDEFSKNTTAFSEKHAVLLKKTETNVTEAWNRVKEIEEKIKRIFNVVGNISISGDYKNTADKECKAANWLRGISVTLMLLMAVVAGYTFWHSLTHPEVDWKLFAFRLGTTIIIALPALYLAQESSKHRQREITNRKLHLELAAIDAYLELLPDAEKQKIKGGLTEKFFGKTEVMHKEDAITQHQFFNLISDVLKNLTKSK